MFNIFEILLNSCRVYLGWLTLRLFRGRPASGERPGTTPHLLLMAWAFPPEVNGGVDRPAALARYAAKAGWNVTVIAGPLEGHPAVTDMAAGVRVVRPTHAPRTSYRLLPKIDGGVAELLVAYRTAFAACAKESPTVVLVSGPPFMTFLSAYFCARDFNVPLVLDYRDEWTVGTPHWVSVSALDMKWERRVLRSADAVIFVNEAIRDSYLSAISQLSATKCSVITNGWEPSDFSRAAAASGKNIAMPCEKRFVLSYVGTIGRYTDPAGFLEALERILVNHLDVRNRLRLRFVGPVREPARQSLVRFSTRFSDVIETVGSVQKIAAVQEILAADGLLLLLDSPRGSKPISYDPTIPGKLFEYLASNAAILTFGDSSQAATLVKELGAGIAVPVNDGGALEFALLSIMRAQSTQWQTHKRKAWIAGYTREALSGRMLGLLENVSRPALGKRP